MEKGIEEAELFFRVNFKTKLGSLLEDKIIKTLRQLNKEKGEKVNKKFKYNNIIIKKC